MSETRPRATSEQFVKVFLDRDKYDTKEKAAAALEMAVSSYVQRVKRERDRYPELFDAVPEYPRSTAITPKSEMAELFAKFAPQSESEDTAEDYEDVE